MVVEFANELHHEECLDDEQRTAAIPVETASGKCATCGYQFDDEEADEFFEPEEE